MEIFKLIIELITALAWPIVALIFIFSFRKSISTALSRLKKGKGFGIEVELEPEASQLREAVQNSEQEIVEVSAIKPLPDTEQFAIETGEIDKNINEVLEAALVNPKLGIMRLSSVLERDLRILVALLGLLDPKARVSPTQLLDTLVGKGFLPKHTTNSLKLFWELRNRIVHGHEAAEEDSILGVLDTGLVLLKRIRSIPHEIHVVDNSSIDLFSDEQCSKLREGVKGLILESTTVGKTRKYKRIFPTTKWEYYKKGKQVTWEWSLLNSWGETWYIDPDTTEKKIAWSSAGEFVGRHIEELMA